jgi:hypothetical protein
VIAAAQGKPVSPVQLQKSLFLIDKNLSPAQRGGGAFYNFRAYDYGPFDSAIYSDADLLEAEGLVTITDPQQSHRTYSVTPTGMDRANALRDERPAAVIAYLDKVVQWVRGRSFSDLVRAIYEQYPEMRVNSVFRG